MAFSIRAWLGRGPTMCEVCVDCRPRGGTVCVGCIQGQGEWAWVFLGVHGGRFAANGWAGRAAGRGAPLGGCVRIVECGGC